MCEYCAKDRGNRNIMSVDFKSLVFDLSVANFVGYVLYATNGEDHSIAKINFCPMCGRKLGEQ